MQSKRYLLRYFIVMIIFIIGVFIYGAKLLNMQIAGGGSVQVGGNSEVYEWASFTVPALRGEIYDRHGTPLVTNKLVYNLTIDGKKFPSKNLAQVTEHIVKLIKLINSCGGEIVESGLPIIVAGKRDDGSYIYSYSTAYAANPNINVQLNKFIEENGFPPHISPSQFVNSLMFRYSIEQFLPNGENDELFMKILGVCYDLDRQKIFLKANRYKISSDINIKLSSAIGENVLDYAGVEILPGYERIYNYPASAPHLMGTIGVIFEEEWENYKSKGYEMDAIVGKSGIEYAFEDYLRGQDGVLIRGYDKEGKVIDEHWKQEFDSNGRLIKVKEPVAGKNVYLTLDIKLQQVAEKSVERTIERIHALAETTGNPELNGLDANAGSAAVIIPSTGEVLALPTYPRYDLSTLKENYEELAKDKENSPFLNRALMGQYAPGSVFKVVTSIAALNSGNLTPEEKILTLGSYDKYDDYKPACWIYNMYRLAHGAINVRDALRVSCNYFYFVVSERIGINLLDEYARHLGLGEYTGIEVGETKGHLASPEYKENNAAVWTPGDLLQASIGQGDHGFSPLQLATMLGTVLNDGARYKSHLLLCVKEYGSDEIYYAPATEMVDKIEIAPENLEIVKLGMSDVVEPGGTGAILFKDLSGLNVGGKTGTVQIKATQSDNATIVAFAPYEQPEIAMSVVVEKGAKGTWAGFVAEDVFAYYFGYKSFNASMDLPEEEVEEETEVGGDALVVPNENDMTENENVE